MLRDEANSVAVSAESMDCSPSTRNEMLEGHDVSLSGRTGRDHRFSLIERRGETSHKVEEFMVIETTFGKDRPASAGPLGAAVLRRAWETTPSMRFQRTLVRGFSVLMLGLFSPVSSAAVLDITAVFVPDPANPMMNKFTNTTPTSGYCSALPTFCAVWGLFSLRTTLSFSANGPIAANNEMRQGAMFKVPSQWRPVQVTHNRTGEQETVEMRIGALGGWHELGATASQITGGGTHSNVWAGGSWARDALPCLRTNDQQGTGSGMAYFWRIPEGDGTCVKQALFQVPNLRYTSIHLAYELRTPNPLTMSSGEYQGSLTYTGPGMDFDMGDVMIPNDGALTFNFSLSVEHTLKVELPPGGTRVELIPQGGWQAWLNQGRKPARLFRDQTFNISASSRFKMQMLCERVIGDTCALRNNTDNHEVPVNVSVSLPHGLNRPDGAAVDRQPLLLSGVGTELFQPGFYVNRRPGTLHFEVGKTSADEMLIRGGSTYAGQVTVIWDSEI